MMRRRRRSLYLCSAAALAFGWLACNARPVAPLDGPDVDDAAAEGSDAADAADAIGTTPAIDASEGDASEDAPAD